MAANGREAIDILERKRIDIVITDHRVTDRAAAMLEAADIKLIVAQPHAATQENRA